ncbi:MAG: CubicO group peptidase (beta-lactamase class C family) [Paraglaciecola sp.]|jgi:CubicO group peptidase (beta-lactamase class C family)
MASVPIHGVWEAEFNSVVEAFSENFNVQSPILEKGAAFTVVKQGQVVVDVYGGIRNIAGDAWQQDTLVNVFSTTKGAVALCVAHLVERGLLNYSDKIAQHWPQFAANGKQDITLAQLLSHQGSLNAFQAPTSAEDLRNWDVCCNKLAAQAPFFTPGTTTCYHPVTFGFLVGEIVRRVTGVTIGQYLRVYICQPQNIDFYIGLSKKNHATVADLLTPTRPPYLPEHIPEHVLLSMINPKLRADFMLQTQTRRAELPAVNGHGTANAIARLYDLFATRNGLLSHETVMQASKVQSTRVDELLALPVHWGMGLVINANVNTYGPEPTTLGHSGWGGSFGCHDPVNELSMGYVCNQMSPDLVGDARGQNLIKQVYASLV